MQFKNFFNAYDLGGVQHQGFLQSMDFSGIISDAPFISGLTMIIMDAQLYNQFSNGLVLRQWKNYMAFNKALDRLEISSQFYTDFVPAIASKLFKTDKWLQLTQTDFRSLSATDIYTFEHGEKETEKEHGQQQREKEYGQRETEKEYGAHETEREYGAHETEREYGAHETEREYGAHETEREYGAHETEREYDKVVVTVERGDETHIVGAAHIEGSVTNTGLLYPLGASAYVDDTKNIQASESDNDEQTNTDKFGNVETSTDGRTDTETSKTHTDTETSKLHTDTETSKLHTDTETRKTFTDTDTLKTFTDTDTIKAYTDTERRTRFVILSPEKYFAIQKELADIGAYDLMAEAVKRVMLLEAWEGGLF